MPADPEESWLTSENHTKWARARTACRSSNPYGCATFCERGGACFVPERSAQLARHVRLLADEEGITIGDLVWALAGRAGPYLLLLFALAPLAAEVREVRALVTAYSPGVDGGGAGTWLTSTGASCWRRPHGVAADPRLLPYGALVLVGDYPDRGDYAWHRVDDTGAAMRRAGARGVLHLDLRMRTAAQARAWGARWVTVHVYIPEQP